MIEAIDAETAEIDKATVAITEHTVKPLAMQDDAAVFCCPRCGRRVAIKPGKPYLDICGARITVEAIGAGE